MAKVDHLDKRPVEGHYYPYTYRGFSRAAGDCGDSSPGRRTRRGVRTRYERLKGSKAM